MAGSATQGAAGYVVSDYYNLEDAYSIKRKYNLSDKIVSLDRTYAPLDYRFRQMGKKIVVTDPEPKSFERTEVPSKFTINTAASTTDYENDTLGITDAQARWMQSNDVFVVPQVFCNSDGSSFSTTKYAYAGAENVTVVSVDLSGVSAGVAKVKVRRGNGVNASASGAGVVTQLTTSHTLLWAGNHLADGGNAPVAKDHEPTSVQNYLEYFSLTYGEDDVHTNTEMYAKESMQQRGTRRRKDMLRQIEHAYFFGRMAKDYVGGKPRRRTGGLVEFVADETTALDGETRRFNFASTFSMELWRKYTEILFRYGNGSGRKWLFVGGKFYTELYNYLQKSLVFNDKISKAVGINVTEIDTGHGILELMRHPMLTDMSTSNVEYSVDGIAVDPTFIDIMTMKNLDLQMRDINPGRSHSAESEIFGMTGLLRHHASAHGLFYGITESV